MKGRTEAVHLLCLLLPLVTCVQQSEGRVHRVARSDLADSLDMVVERQGERLSALEADNAELKGLLLDLQGRNQLLANTVNFLLSVTTTTASTTTTTIPSTTTTTPSTTATTSTTTTTTAGSTPSTTATVTNTTMTCAPVEAAADCPATVGDLQALQQLANHLQETNNDQTSQLSNLRTDNQQLQSQLQTLDSRYHTLALVVGEFNNNIDSLQAESQLQQQQMDNITRLLSVSQAANLSGSVQALQASVLALSHQNPQSAGGGSGSSCTTFEAQAAREEYLDTGEPVVFLDIVSQQGPPFSVVNGKFVVGTTGLYFLQAAVSANARDNTEFELKVNDKSLSQSNSPHMGPGGGDVDFTLQALTILHTGDRVWVEVSNGHHSTTVYRGPDTSFTARLLNAC